MVAINLVQFGNNIHNQDISEQNSHENTHNRIAQLLEEIHNLPYDRESIPQENLDLANKYRSSMFPWRGQFSPELIETFLRTYSQEQTVVLDPFVGSGTTVFEASAKGLACYGAEINPSAVEMAASAHFTNISIAERNEAIRAALEIAQECVGPFTWDLFSAPGIERRSPEEFTAALESILRLMLQKSQYKVFVYNILANSIIRFMSLKPPLKAENFLLALKEHSRIIEKLPYSEKFATYFMRMPEAFLY